MLNHSSKRKARGKPKILLGIATVFMLAFGAVILDPAPQGASAATMGPGYHGNAVGNLDVPHLGGWRTSTGHLAYCIEPGRTNPTGNQNAPQDVTTLPGYTASSLGHNLTISAANGITLARISYVLNKWGDTTSNRQAAAVQMAIWIQRGAPTNYLQTFYNNSAFSGSNPPSFNTLRNQAQGYVDEAASAVTAVATGTPSLEMELTSGYNGNITMTGGNGWRANVTLDGARFNQNNAATKSMTGGETAQLTAQASGTPGEKYSVEATGTATGYPNQVKLHSAVTTNQQRLASGTAPRTVQMSDFADDPFEFFSPIVTTTVRDKYVPIGGQFVDILTFGVTDKFDAVSNPNGGSPTWMVNLATGNPLPIIARATLYETLDRAPVVSASPPAGAVAIDTVTISTGTTGDTQTYNLPANTTATRPGYSTWVVEIRYEDQSGIVQALLPNNYYYSHEYGLPAETHITPFAVEISTELSKHEVGLGEELTDEVTVNLDSEWWLKQTNGANESVNLVGTVYYSANEPVQTANAPAGAEVVTTLTHTVSDDTVFTSDVFTAPMKAGYVTVQWCVAGNQPLVAPFCDDYGVPAETAQIVLPTVSSLATEYAHPGETITDQGIIDGIMPTGGVNIWFDAYLQDTNSDVAMCTVDNHIFTSETIFTDEAGTFTSSNFIVDPTLPMGDNGERVIYWVERAEIAETGQLFHEGECGIANETTRIVKPEVTTKATETGFQVDDVNDTAIVSGKIVTDSELIFRLYEADIDGVKSEQCTIENVVFTSTPVAVPAGDYDGQEFLSESTRVEKGGTYYWVETLTTKDGIVLHEGECGLENETTTIVTPEITTKATPTGSTKDPVNDTAIIRGEVVSDSDLTFRLYKAGQGEKAEQCVADNLVFTSTTTNIPAGSYDGEEFVSNATLLKETGTYYWVETLATKDGRTVHEGECGLDNETTKIIPDLADSGIGESPVGLMALAGSGILSGISILGFMLW